MIQSSRQECQKMTDVSEKKPPVALIMAGGTGGHIFPGLAVAQELIANGWSLYWLGSKGGMEELIVGKNNIPLNLIDISGLRGNGLLGWLAAPFSLVKAVWQAAKVVNKTSPDVVLGFGGFVSGPGGFAAFILRKILIIHEQNAIAGLTNKVLSRFANRVFQAFPNTFIESREVETIGNPIRKEIKSIAHVDEAEISECINVLVIGGSRGAQALNQNIPKILACYLDTDKIRVRHQCGEAGFEVTTNQYEKYVSEVSAKVKVEKFIDDMAGAYLWADVVICRAGALTVSEIAAVGVVSILVPFPFAVDDHQTLNARWLVDNDAAILIQQSELLIDESIKEISDLLSNKKKIEQMSINAKNMAYLEATETMSLACKSFLKEVA